MFDQIFDDRDDEVTVFRTVNFGKQAVIGNVSHSYPWEKQRGQLQLHDLASGERLANLVGHGSDVNLLQVDYANKLILSAGYDCAV